MMVYQIKPQIIKTEIYHRGKFRNAAGINIFRKKSSQAAFNVSETLEAIHGLPDLINVTISKPRIKKSMGI